MRPACSLRVPFGWRGSTEPLLTLSPKPFSAVRDLLASTRGGTLHSLGFSAGPRLGDGFCSSSGIGSHHDAAPASASTPPPPVGAAA